MEKDILIAEYFKDGELMIKEIVNCFSRYTYTVIENVSKGILKNDDIEEIISDVFLAIWKNKEKLERDYPLKPYIAAIARNLTKNKLRALKIYQIEELEENEIFYSKEVEEIIESKEKIHLIEKTLEEFGEDSKIFVMFYYKGMKAREIFEKTEQTEWNINTKLHRMRKKIKTRLEERGYYYEQ